MKISLNSLNNFSKKSLTAKEYSKALFQLGHEHEFSNDIFDIEFTPNKGDCLSIHGLVRDLSSLLEMSPKIDIYEGKIKKLNYYFENKIPNFCKKISFLKIKTTGKHKSYKNYLENYFDTTQTNKVNFFTDISNYVAYEVGQPTHCYDYKYVEDGLILSTLEEEKEFKTLLGNKIKLTKGEEVFQNKTSILNLAGVMGGNDAKCYSDTNEILLESATFNPDRIIGKTVKYNLISDSAYKFERGVDANLQEIAIRRFLKIVEEHTDIIDCSYISFTYDNEENSAQHIEYNFNKINQILGTKLEENTVKNILSNLGFIISDKISVPSWRSDINSLNDISEEIARVIGYDNISTTDIEIPNKATKSYFDNKTNKLRKFLIDKGFYELINHPFESSDLSNMITIDNPLDNTRSRLRSSLRNSLIEKLDFNEKRQKDSIKFFEISSIYELDKFKKISQKNMLCLIVSGRISNDPKSFNIKFNRDHLQHLFSDFVISDNDIYEIDRKSINSKIKDKIYIIEIDINSIDKNFYNMADKFSPPNKFIKYEPISEFPSSHRDVSISVKNQSILETMLESIFNYEHGDIKETLIFDYYENKNESIIKIGFRFIFQSKIKTLIDKEIDQEMQKIFKLFLKFEGVEIPGLSL